MLLVPAPKGEPYDLTGIMLGYALSLFAKVNGGYLAAKKLVKYNLRCGKPVLPKGGFTKRLYV